MSLRLLLINYNSYNIQRCTVFQLHISERTDNEKILFNTSKYNIGENISVSHPFLMRFTVLEKFMILFLLPTLNGFGLNFVWKLLVLIHFYLRDLN
jgi:hypothetical protein